MVDFSIEEKLKNGINFTDIFKSLFLYSMSIFLGFWWKDFFDEIILLYMPAGHNMLEKAAIGVAVTIVIVSISYIITRREKKHEENPGRKCVV